MGRKAVTGVSRTARGNGSVRFLSTSRKTAVVLAAVALCGLLAGLVSTQLPVKIILFLAAGAILLVVIYQWLWLGVAIFIFFNLTLPQAGPTWNLGIQVAMVGETRGIHFNIHEIVMALTFVAWVIKAARGKAEWKARSPITVAIVAYVLTSILACFVGLLHDANGLVMAFRFVRTVIFAYVFFVVINIVRTRLAFRNLVILMLVCFTLVALFGLVQKAIGQTKTEWFAQHVLGKLGYPESVNYVAGESEAQAYRINSTFLHPNVLGGYLIFALPFFVSLLSLAWRGRRYFPWFLLLAGMGINMAALFLTGSRAAWVAAGVIAVLYGLFGLFDRRLWLTAATVVLVLALVFVMLNPPEFVKKRFSGLSAKEAAQVRIYTYKLALDYFLEHPIFGIGMGMEGQRIIENNIRQTWAAVENAFLTYLVSHGLVGFTAFLLLFAIYWGVLLRARSRSRNDPFIYFHAEAFFLGMVGYAVANMFGAWILFAIPMLTLFWVYLALGGALYNIYREGIVEEKEPLFHNLPELLAVSPVPGNRDSSPPSPPPHAWTGLPTPGRIS